MNVDKKYQSEQLMVCHQDAEALYKIGAISKAEMRKFDEDCLVRKPVNNAFIPAYIQPQEA
jgi:putative transcriptional regulator